MHLGGEALSRGEVARAHGGGQSVANVVRRLDRVVETINGSGELMKEIDRRLRVSDAVIRHLVVRVDEELRVAERTREARTSATARRRVARGLPPERQPGEGRGDGDQNDDMDGAEGQR